MCHRMWPEYSVQPRTVISQEVKEDEVPTAHNGRHEIMQLLLNSVGAEDSMALVCKGQASSPCSITSSTELG